MTINEFQNQKAECAKILKLIAETEQHQEQIKGLFLKIFDIYKKTGIKPAKFEEVIKEL